MLEIIILLLLYIPFSIIKTIVSRRRWGEQEYSGEAFWIRYVTRVTKKIFIARTAY
jgi:hypothetical protein